MRSLIDRKVGDCIGIKRIVSLGYRVYPETIPTHVYISYTHFFELIELVQYMIKSDITGDVPAMCIKFVKCTLERDMTDKRRETVHYDSYGSIDCSQCRKFFDELKSKSVWWLQIGNHKFLKITFKDFVETNSFRCSYFWMKVTGLLEVQLQIEDDDSSGSFERRNFSLVRNKSYSLKVIFFVLK